jgi:hypothetical protein
VILTVADRLRAAIIGAEMLAYLVLYIIDGFERSGSAEEYPDQVSLDCTINGLLAILLVADLLQPVHILSIERFLDCNMGHRHLPDDQVVEIGRQVAI